MERQYGKSILQKYPVQTMLIASLVLALIGIVLMLTVVGSIVALPLLLLAAILGLIGSHKYRTQRSAGS